MSGIGYTQTATNFNCKDCNDVTHDLFTELDAGLVVVLDWVMPCGSCIAPSRSAYDVVQTYATSHPGRVVFYLVDDFADTPCGTIISWGNTNGMPNSVHFSNAVIDPTDYGAVGMPKIIVLGGTAHTVYYNEDYGANLAGLPAAIDLALAASGIEDSNADASMFNVYVNPGTNQATISYTLDIAGNVSFDLFDASGKNLKTISFEEQAPGNHMFQFELGEVSQGIYLMKMNIGENSKAMKFAYIK